MSNYTAVALRMLAKTAETDINYSFSEPMVVLSQKTVLAIAEMLENQSTQITHVRRSLKGILDTPAPPCVLPSDG